MLRRWSIVCLLLPLPLSSCLLRKALGVPADCEEYRMTVAFPDDPRIVQGAWQGLLNGYPAEGAATELHLELDARYLNEDEYAVSGSFRLGDEEEKALEGTVEGNCSERYSSSSATTLEAESALEPSSLPPSAGLDAEVRLADGRLLWTLRASWGGFGYPPLEQGLSGSLRSAENESFSFELERRSRSAVETTNTHTSALTPNSLPRHWRSNDESFERCAVPHNAPHSGRDRLHRRAAGHARRGRR